MAWPLTGQTPQMIGIGTGLFERWQGYAAKQEAAGLDTGAAGFFGLLNVAGDMVGVNSIYRGAYRQDLYSGATLSTAEANAELGVGIASVSALLAGAAIKGFKSTGLKGEAPTAAAKNLSGAADDVVVNGKSVCPAGTAKCFVAGTQVLVMGANGARVAKNIEDVEVGDQVWSRNELSGEEGFKPVEATFVRETDRLIHLTYHRASSRAPGSPRRGQKGGGPDDPDDASTIIGTAEHPFWSLTREGWVEMAELQPGERLLLSDGSEGVVAIVQIESATPWGDGTLGTPTNEHGVFSVYNFKVRDWHTYYTMPDSGCMPTFVHNASCPMGTLTSSPGVELRLGELEAAGAFARENLNVHFELPASTRGVGGVRTADLLVGGREGTGFLGQPIEVYTPRTNSVNAVVRTVAHKLKQSDQIAIVLSHSKISVSELASIIKRVNNVPGRSRPLRRVYFIRNYQVVGGLAN